MQWILNDSGLQTFSADFRTLTTTGDFAVNQIGGKLPSSKTYSEVKLTQLTNVIYNVCLSDVAWLLSAAGWQYGYDTHAFGTDGQAAAVEFGNFGTFIGNIKGSAFAVNDVICFAIDGPNALGWIRVNNGNWNNSGTANPATGTGGIALTTLASDYRISTLAGSPGTGIKAVINTGQATFGYTPPSGFTAPGAGEAMDLVGVATGTNTATMPTHQTGDLIIVSAFRDGSTTAPTIPGGYTNQQTPVGANTCSAVLVSKVAASSGETVGTFTNATSVTVLVMRPRTGYTLSAGASNQNSGASTTVNYAALTLNSIAGKSNVAAFGFHRSTDTALETAPANLSRYVAVVDATDEQAMFLSGLGLTANWPSTNVAVGGTSSGWWSFVIELQATAIATATGNFFEMF